MRLPTLRCTASGPAIPHHLLTPTKQASGESPLPIAPLPSSALRTRCESQSPAAIFRLPLLPVGLNQVQEMTCCKIFLKRTMKEAKVDVCAQDKDACANALVFQEMLSNPLDLILRLLSLFFSDLDDTFVL